MSNKKQTTKDHSIKLGVNKAANTKVYENKKETISFWSKEA